VIAAPLADPTTFESRMARLELLRPKAS